jgi:hypothetical protein
VERLAWRVERGEAGEEQIRALSPAARGELYAFYQRASRPELLSRLAGSLYRAAPRELLRRLRRSLVAGSDRQRERAAAFAATACARAALEELRDARRRAELWHRPLLRDSLARSLARLNSCSESEAPPRGGQGH